MVALHRGHLKGRLMLDLDLTVEMHPLQNLCWHGCTAQLLYFVNSM